MSLSSLEASSKDSAVRLYYPQEMRFKVEFWKDVYTKYTTKQGVLHDSDDLSIIYAKIDLPASGNKGIVQTYRNKVREHLFNILRKKGAYLTTAEKKILAKFPQNATRSRLLRATENIRFQLGQSDRFQNGVIRSGRYMRIIEQVFSEEGVPDFLKYLPHVESSFQPRALSKFSAGGLWQLMPSSAKHLGLKVNYAVDERFDPWQAARAAAQHLKRDYKSLKAWPLALTAYNHGPGGVRRAVKQLGTTDIAEIVFRYSSPRFGFASRNFYAQFLAAVSVATDYQKYFGTLQIEKPLAMKKIKMKTTTYLNQVLKDYSVTMDEFKNLNLHLRQPVLASRRPIPKGTTVFFPEGSKRDPVLVASLDKKAIRTSLDRPPSSKEIDISKVTTTKGVGTKVVTLDTSKDYSVKDFADGKGWVKIEVNESITTVSEWLGVQVDDIRGWNGIDAGGQVGLGQKLLLKFGKTAVNDFEEARKDYHNQIREDFFAQYEVVSFEDHTVAKGENLWSICFQKYDIPPWLLEEYNPKLSLANITPGTKLKVPVIKDSLFAD